MAASLHLKGSRVTFVLFFAGIKVVGLSRPPLPLLARSPPVLLPPVSPFSKPLFIPRD